MDLRKFEAAASATPPTAPGTPSTGYATAGDPSTAVPATKPGPWFFHQMAEETRNLIVGAGVTPDHNTLTQLLAAVTAFSTIVPLGALEFPTVATSNNQVGATVALEAGTGGKVSIPASVALSLGIAVTAGVTGREKTFITSAWASASLIVSSTYYLRAYVDGSGALVPYVQRGADSDSIPAGLVGTPNAASGGGFDSTVLDILLAKVVTGVAGAVPTLTQLANSRGLIAESFLTDAASSSAAANRTATYSHTLNWARTPKTIVSAGFLNSTDAACSNQFTGIVVVSRYKIDHTITVSLEPSAVVSITLQSRALAVA